MVNQDRPPWKGDTKKLAVSIDIGTTYTAASFCVLQPGIVPKFEEILRWPKQAVFDAKVPSSVFYDQSGSAKAFCAEAEDDETVMMSEEESWIECKWWKLHLRPAHLPFIANLDLPPLPPRITVDVVLADFLGYVRQNLETYITTSHGGGDKIWAALYPTMDVILTIPNGWEGVQQQRMRTAAFKAGLVDRHGAQRVRVVTEAEAAVLYAIDTGCIGDWLRVCATGEGHARLSRSSQPDAHLILCDCGGGTIDITSYRISDLSPLELQETTPAACYLAGAVFVASACKTYLEEHLKGTEWGNEAVILRAAEHFDKNGKRKFSDVGSPVLVDLGGFRSSQELGITRGKLRIPGEVVASFFEKSLGAIKEGIQAAHDGSRKLANNVVLVGGLSSSPYAFMHLVSWGMDLGLSVSRPDGPMTKAVANGALAWFVDNPVSARVCKYHYGVEVARPFDPKASEMKGRDVFKSREGELRVDSAWHCIVAKNTVLQAGQEFYQPYRMTWREDQTFFDHTSEIYIYRGATPPTFLRNPDSASLISGFVMTCAVHANLEDAFDAAPATVGKDGKRYRDVIFDLCLVFGQTELTARLRWKTREHEFAYGAATMVHLVE